MPTWFETNHPDAPARMGTFETPPGAPAPAAAPAAAPGAFDRTAFRDAWQSQGAGQSGESLSRFIASHPEFSTGVQQGGAHGDTVTLPTGEQLDLIGDVGGTGQSNWTGVGPGSARSGGGGPGGVGGGGAGTAWGPSGSSFAGGGFSYKPWDQKFVAPTNVTEANDPGFQFRLDQGQRALQRSAAASGTLLTGGTAQDLQNLGQQQASAEYGNVYNRAMQQYQQGYGDYLGNYNRAFQDYQANFANDLSNRELGLRAQGQYFGQDLATNQNQYYQGLTTNQNQFNQQMGLAQLGMGAAGGGAAAAGQNAQAQGNYLTGIGNTTAAGQVGSANAWNGAIGGAVNAGIYGLNQYGQNRPAWSTFTSS